MICDDLRQLQGPLTGGGKLKRCCCDWLCRGGRQHSHSRRRDAGSSLLQLHVARKQVLKQRTSGAPRSRSDDHQLQESLECAYGG